MANPFVHCELNTTDHAKAKAFYGSLFDWKLEDEQMPNGTYTMIDVGDDGTGGGIQQHPTPGAPSQWTPYILVDDIQASTGKAESLGGKIMMGATEIPNMGWFSIVQDPTGAVFGLWKTTRSDAS
jgi:predicted enzyme related to lactoylglutathione lyase